MSQPRSGKQSENSGTPVRRKKLILHNDDFNEFNYVVKILMEVFDFDENQAYQLALLAHYRGSITVKEGRPPDLETFEKELELAGLDTEIC